MNIPYEDLSPEMYEIVVVGGHEPLWVAQVIATDPVDIDLLTRIAKLERDEDRDCRM